MYHFNDMCFLCLVYNKKIKNILSNDRDGIVVEEKLKYIVSEFTYFKPDVPKNICPDCLKDLNIVYKFKQKCFKTMIHLSIYFENQKNNKNFTLPEDNTQKDNDSSNLKEPITENVIEEDSTNSFHEIMIKSEPLSFDDNNIDIASSSSDNFEIQTAKNESQNFEAAKQDAKRKTQISLENTEIIPEEIVIKEESLETDPDIDPLDNQTDSEDNMDFETQDTAENSSLLKIHHTEIPDDPNENFDEISPEIEKVVSQSCNNLLPKKSRKRYDEAYRRFMDWRSGKNKNSTSLAENVFLVYFDEMSKSMQAPTLWAQYSMLRSTVMIRNNVDIATYFRLKCFLKRRSVSYRPKKSKILTANDIDTFLTNAPDEKYLMMKVALIFTVMGACRREELSYMKITDMEDLGNALLVNLPDSKIKTQRSFTITGNFYSICKNYMAMRPTDMKETRFFLNIINEKCTRQVVGINTFGKIPSKIARYLKLPEPEQYTGHCFRKLFAKILVNDGGDITIIDQVVRR